MKLEAVWTVPTDHPAFAGHFPDHPIVPGVLLLDQVLLMAAQQVVRPSHSWMVTQAKFLSPCGPGDELVFNLQASARGAMAFAIRCGGRAIASGNVAPLAP